MNKLYFGDNLNILRDHVEDESVDLIYLDPPFNSKRDYNLLFKTPKGHSSEAQITAFEDSWHWGAEAETEYEELLHQKNTDVAEMIRSLRNFLGTNDMMAYLTMMANRLLELHRVLKPTGSIYLHCDPIASHYLKIVMDAVFGIKNYRNEISWRRSNPKTNTSINLPNCRDIIFRYTKSDKSVFNMIYQSLDESYVEKAYRYKDEKGKSYRLLPLLNPNDDRPNLTYEFLGVKRVWRWTKERMQAAYESGLVVQLKPGAVPQYKKYLEDSLGRTITNDWNDITAVQGNEELGYPTQKPLGLLERIINMSSNEGDVVLDPFCGCGTAVHAAQKLKRQWIGIDITVLAINLIESRLKHAFPGIGYEVEGLPTHLDEARSLAERDKYQFQWWACTLVGAQAYQGKKKGADGGIDGLIYFQDDNTGAKKIVVSVKGGENVSVSMIRDFAHVIDREKAAMGFFVTLSKPTAPMMTEAVSAGFYNQPDLRNYRKIQILTIEGLLNKTERPDYPDTSLGALTHKKAQVEKKNKGQEGMF
jgi:adenine specific DNA methylase Mod